MVDTLSEIRTESGQAPLLLMIGQDAANELDSWHEWRRIFELAHLVIMRRPDSRVAWKGELGTEMENRLAQALSSLEGSPAGKVLPLEVTQLAISSTHIRELLAEGLSPRFLLPETVLDYIRRNRLYGAAG